jgi:hypothetical protein
MTNEEAKKMLEAKLECMKRETSGTDIDCNYRNCDECSLCYEQGNMGEQKEALGMAIKALEQQPCDEIHGSTYGGVSWGGTYKPQQPCEDCISREEAIKHTHIEYDDDGIGHRVVYAEDIEALPSVTPTIPEDEDNFDIGYNCGYADAMCDIGGED